MKDTQTVPSTTTRRNPIILALDSANCSDIRELVNLVRPHIGMVKIGLEFYLKYNHAGYQDVNFPTVMLDLKLHDIPNTVAGAMRSILPLMPRFVTVHAAGGPEMIQAARKEAEAYGGCDRPSILAVTVLTSLTDEHLRQLGFEHDACMAAAKLADVAMESGADGLVCSPHEVHLLRQRHSKAILVVPGIRLPEDGQDDQARVSTPGQALRDGADWLVIGRPITQAPCPAETAQKILWRVCNEH